MGKERKKWRGKRKNVLGLNLLIEGTFYHLRLSASLFNSLSLYLLPAILHSTTQTRYQSADWKPACPPPPL